MRRSAAGPERVDRLARYQLTLERQISKQLGEVVHLYDRRLHAVRTRRKLVLSEPGPPAGTHASQAARSAASQAPDIVDV